MRSSRRFAVTLRLVLACVAPAVWASGVPEQPRDTYIAVIAKGFQHEFWRAVRLGAETAAAERGITATFEGPAYESMVDLQINMVENAIHKRADAILLAANDAVALAPFVSRAKEAGIVVGTFDSGVDGVEVVTHVATDNRAAAALAAERLAGLIDRRGTVGLIVHDEVSRTGIERRDGFIEHMQRYPDIHVLPAVYGGGDHRRSAALAEDLLNANPDLVAMFAANEGSAVGAAQGLERAGRAGDVVLIGFDASEAEIEYLRAGVIQGFVVQNPYAMGYLGVTTLIDALRGRVVPTFVDTGATYVEPRNLLSPDVQRLLNPMRRVDARP